jgi:hypothetical protein
MFILLCSAKWVKVNGTKYQTPCALVVGKDEADELEFGKVENIYVYENSALFEFIPLLTRQFHHHHHAFVLAMPPISARSQYLIKQKELLDYHPYGLYTCAHIVSDSLLQYYVILRSNVYAPLCT